MQQQCRKLRLFLRLTGIEEYFYDIDIRQNEISMQGYYNAHLAGALKRKGWQIFIGDEGYFRARKRKIKIVLT